jgi:hypothetical protein
LRLRVRSWRDGVQEVSAPRGEAQVHHLGVPEVVKEQACAFWLEAHRLSEPSRCNELKVDDVLQYSLREVDGDVVLLESVLGEESSARGVGFLDGHGLAEESVVNRIFEGLVGHANAIGVLKRVALDVS